MIATRVSVVDASAASALLFGEPDGPTIADRLRDARLVAPALLHFEVMNTCWKKITRHPADHEGLLAGLRLLADMTIDIVAVDWMEVVDLAGQSRLTAYDASYLWLARRLGAELVTLDTKLAAAAG